MKRLTESQTLELKAMVPDKNVLLETIYSFANTDGGTIIIGYDEVRQSKIGISRKSCDYVVNALSSLPPTIIHSIKKERIDVDKYCLIISVDKSKKKEYFKGKEYKRIGNKTTFDYGEEDVSNAHQVSSPETDNEDSIEHLIYTDNLTLDDPYVRCLDKLIRGNPNISNIGVIGPYGSGKSSIVHSYINLDKKRKNRTLFFSQETIKKYFDEKHNSSSEQRSDDNAINIKSFIYLELLRCDRDAINYKKYLYNLATSKSQKYLWLFFSCSISLVAGLAGFAILFKSVPLWASIIVGILISLIVGYIFFSYEAIRFKLIGKNGEIEFVSKNSDIEYNIKKNPASMDNLVLKILSKRKISFIVIEDMERLKDYGKNDKNVVLDIIENFKVISDLINRSDVFNDKNRIRFIYGLNDDCFSTSEKRSKYFDAIIPVIPVTTNIGAVTVINNHKVLKDKTISDTIVRDISLFFENQRQVNAFITQFYLATSYVKLELYDELFALTAFNVLFPQEYHKLYNNSERLKKYLLGEVTEYIEIDKNDKDRNYVAKKINDFLALLKNKGYINLTFEECLTRNNGLHSLSANDMKYLVDSANGKDTFFYVIDKPDKVINYYEDTILFGKNEYLNYYLIDYIYKNSFSNEINCFVSSFNNYSEQKIIKLISEIYNNSSEEVIEIFISHFNDNKHIYSAVSHIKDSKKRETVVSLLVKYLKPQIIKDDKETENTLFKVIKSKEYIYRFKKTLNVSLLKMLFYEESKKLETVLFIDDKEVLDFIRANLIYPFNKTSIEYLYNDYHVRPIRTINDNHNTLGLYFAKNDTKDYNSVLPPFSSTIEDKKEDVMHLIEVNPDNNLDKLLSTKYFDNWKLKLIITTSPFLPIRNEKLIKRYQAAIDYNLIEPNSAYSMYFSYKEPDNFISYIKNNIDVIRKNGMKLDNQASLFLLKNIKDIQIFKDMQDVLDYTMMSSHISALPLNSLVVLHEKSNDDSIKEQIIKRIWQLDKNCLLDETILLSNPVPLNLEQNDCKLIIDKDCKQLFYLLFLTVNSASVKQYLDGGGSKKQLKKILEQIDSSYIENYGLLTDILVSSDIDLDSDITTIEKLEYKKERKELFLKVLKAYLKERRGSYYLPSSESGKRLLSVYKTIGILKEEKTNSKGLIRVSIVSQ